MKKQKKQRWACLLVPLVLLLVAFLFAAGEQQEARAREVKVTAWIAAGPGWMEWADYQIKEAARLVTEELAAEGKDITLVVDISLYPGDWGEHLKRYLDIIFRATVNQPFPELRDACHGVIIAVRIYEDIGV